MLSRMLASGLKKFKEEFTMSKSKQTEVNNMLQHEHQEQVAPLVQDVRDPAMTTHYDSLSETEYLDVVWGEMKALFNICDFESRKNEPEEIHGDVCTRLNNVFWPVIPSQLHEFSKSSIEAAKNAEAHGDETETNPIKTKIDFYIPHHKMIAKYGGSFHIKNAVIRAKFAGDENGHSFYIGEHDKLSADVLIGQIDDEGSLLALMVDGRIPESAEAEMLKLWESGQQKQFSYIRDAAELEEFTMLAVTDGKYYKNYMKARAVNEDLAIFTHYNKARNLLHDTVASFKDGLCDPETIFNCSDTEDVLAEWARNLTK